MPHVGSHFQPSPLARESTNVLGLEMPMESLDYLQPAASIPRERNRWIRSTPSLSRLAITPENRCDNGFIRHNRDFSKDNTPVSAIDSVFELPSVYIESPNSSAHNSFIAELEDTSVALMANRPAYPANHNQRAVSDPPTMRFKTSEITARAVIQVVDETIANIEIANKELLSRAVAAEEAAQILRKQNLTLQLKINQYKQDHSRKTAPVQSTVALGKQTPKTPTPVSSFNTNINRLSTQRPNRIHKPPQYPLAYRQRSRTQSNPMMKPLKPDQAQDPFTSTSGLALTTHRFSRPLPLLPSHLDVPSPLSGSVVRYEDILNGSPISSSERKARNVSLNEARRREKPLPPLGPMSPSVLRGVVEIGMPRGFDEFGRARDPSPTPERRVLIKRITGLGALFQRRRKDAGRFI